MRRIPRVRLVARATWLVLAAAATAVVAARAIAQETAPARTRVLVSEVIVGARVVGGRGGHFGERLGGALIGILAGAGAFKLAGGDADQTLALVAFPIAQSLVTVFLTPRD